MALPGREDVLILDELHARYRCRRGSRSTPSHQDGPKRCKAVIVISSNSRKSSASQATLAYGRITGEVKGRRHTQDLMELATIEPRKGGAEMTAEISLVDTLKANLRQGDLPCVRRHCRPVLGVQRHLLSSAA